MDRPARTTFGCSTSLGISRRDSRLKQRATIIQSGHQTGTASLFLPVAKGSGTFIKSRQAVPATPKPSTNLTSGNASLIGRETDVTSFTKQRTRRRKEICGCFLWKGTESQYHFCKLSSTSFKLISLRTGVGLLIHRAKQENLKCTFRLFPLPERSGRYRLTAAVSPSGVTTAKNCSI